MNYAYGLLHPFTYLFSNSEVERHEQRGDDLLHHIEERDAGQPRIANTGHQSLLSYTFAALFSRQPAPPQQKPPLAVQLADFLAQHDDSHQGKEMIHHLDSGAPISLEIVQHTTRIALRITHHDICTLLIDILETLDDNESSLAIEYNLILQHASNKGFIDQGCPT